MKPLATASDLLRALNDRRMALGWTRTDLATAMGTTPAQISRWLNNTRIDGETAMRMAKVMGGAIFYSPDSKR